MVPWTAIVLIWVPVAVLSKGPNSRIAPPHHIQRSFQHPRYRLLDPAPPAPFPSYFTPPLVLRSEASQLPSLLLCAYDWRIVFHLCLPMYSGHLQLPLHYFSFSSWAREVHCQPLGLGFPLLNLCLLLDNYCLYLISPVIEYTTGFPLKTGFPLSRIIAFSTD